jgi:hypothetical protein
MTDLIINMMYYYDRFSNNSKFSKEEIINLINEYDIVDQKSYSVLGAIILYEWKLIDENVLADRLDLKYEEGKYWLYIDSFDEILDKSKYSIEINILEQDNDRYGSSWYDIDIDWDMISTDTLSYIKNHIINNIGSAEIEDEDIVFNEENIKIENDKLYLILNDDNIEIDDSFMKDYVEFSDLYRDLQWSFIDAQQVADEDEMEKEIINSFENEIGFFTREMKEKKYYDSKLDKQVTKDVEFIKIRLDNLNMKSLKDELISYTINKYMIQGETDTYMGDRFKEIGRELDMFDFHTPDYNYVYGSIDKEYLNDDIINRLD